MKKIDFSSDFYDNKAYNKKLTSDQVIDIKIQYALLLEKRRRVQEAHKEYFKLSKEYVKECKKSGFAALGKKYKVNKTTIMRIVNDTHGSERIKNPHKI